MYDVAFRPYRLPSDTQVLSHYLRRTVPDLKPDFVVMCTTASTARVASTGERVKKGTISAAAFARENKPCTRCGKHLAAKSFTRHYKTGACDKYAEANPSAAVEAAAYYNSRFGKDDVVADSMGGCVLSQSEFSALQSQLVYHDRVTDGKESGDY